MSACLPKSSFPASAKRVLRNSVALLGAGVLAVVLVLAGAVGPAGDARAVPSRGGYGDSDGYDDGHGDSDGHGDGGSGGTDFGVWLPVTAKGHPGVALHTERFAMKAGEKRFLVTRPLRVGHGSWGKGHAVDVGVTTLVRCRLNGKKVLVAHSGENLTRDEPGISPRVRALLEADTTGTYECEMTASAYSTGWAPGMGLRLYGPTSFAVKRAGRESRTWGAGAENRVLRPGGKYRPMDGTVPGNSGNAAIGVFADAEVTTCVAPESYGGICSRRDPKATGALVESWLEVQGKDAAGADIGPRHRSAAEQRWISSGKHHGMLNHHASTPLPLGAVEADVGLRVRVVRGDDVVFHGGYGHARVVSPR